MNAHPMGWPVLPATNATLDPNSLRAPAESLIDLALSSTHGSFQSTTGTDVVARHASTFEAVNGLTDVATMQPASSTGGYIDNAYSSPRDKGLAEEYVCFRFGLYPLRSLYSEAPAKLRAWLGNRAPASYAASKKQAAYLSNVTPDKIIMPPCDAYFLTVYSSTLLGTGYFGSTSESLIPAAIHAMNVLRPSPRQGNCMGMPTGRAMQQSDVTSRNAVRPFPELTRITGTSWNIRKMPNDIRANTARDTAVPALSSAKTILPNISEGTIKWPLKKRVMITMVLSAATIGTARDTLKRMIVGCDLVQLEHSPQSPTLQST
jgi:hypothetical protein